MSNLFWSPLIEDSGQGTFIDPFAKNSSAKSLHWNNSSCPRWKELLEVASCSEFHIVDTHINSLAPTARQSLQGDLPLNDIIIGHSCLHWLAAVPSTYLKCRDTHQGMMEIRGTSCSCENVRQSPKTWKKLRVKSIMWRMKDLQLSCRFKNQSKAPKFPARPKRISAKKLQFKCKNPGESSFRVKFLWSIA